MLGLIVGIVIGAIAGFAANLITNNKSNSAVIDCFVGMFGGAIGLSLFGLLGFQATNIIAELISAVVGAVIIISIKQWILKKINK